MYAMHILLTTAPLWTKAAHGLPTASSTPLGKLLIWLSILEFNAPINAPASARIFLRRDVLLIWKSTLDATLFATILAKH